MATIVFFLTNSFNLKQTGYRTRLHNVYMAAHLYWSFIIDNATLVNLIWIYLAMNLENSRKNLGAMIYALEFGLRSWIAVQ